MRLLLTLAVALLLSAPAQAADKLKLLIIDGQNNHNWKAMTPPMREASLERTGRFTVERGDIARRQGAHRRRGTRSAPSSPSMTPC